MKILGLDCSSTCIGWGLINIDNSDLTLIDSGFIKPMKTGSIIERIADTRDKINKLLSDTSPDDIAIEDIIQFMKGASSAKTIIMLTTFNRMICLACHDYIGHSPELYNVMSIRHGIKLTKVLPKKEEIPEVIAERLKIDFPYVLGKKDKIKVESYDRADGIAVALYRSLILTNKIKKK